MKGAPHGSSERSWDTARWALCFCIALAFHCGAAYAVLTRRPPFATTEIASAPVLLELAPSAASPAHKHREEAADDDQARPESASSPPRTLESVEEPSARSSALARPEPEDIQQDIAGTAEMSPLVPAARQEDSSQLALQLPPDVDPLDLTISTKKSDVELPVAEPELARDASPVENPRREDPTRAQRSKPFDPTTARKPRGVPPERPAKAREPERRQRFISATQPAANDPNFTRSSMAGTGSAQRQDQGAAGAQGTAIAASALAAWQSRVSAHIERHKRYPAGADPAREAGTARIAFALDRQGRVLSRRLVASSGSAALDRETVELIGRAQPMPAPPAELKQPRFDLAIGITFRRQ